MALSKKIQITGRATVSSGMFTFDVGDQTVTFDAYVKVESVLSTKDTASAVVSFTGDEGRLERSYNFVPAMDGDNFIKQVYLHLKTLPEFEGAQDC